MVYISTSLLHDYCKSDVFCGRNLQVREHGSRGMCSISSDAHTVNHLIHAWMWLRWEQTKLRVFPLRCRGSRSSPEDLYKRGAPSGGGGRNMEFFICIWYICWFSSGCIKLPAHPSLKDTGTQTFFCRNIYCFDIYSVKDERPSEQSRRQLGIHFKVTNVWNSRQAGVYLTESSRTWTTRCCNTQSWCSMKSIDGNRNNMRSMSIVLHI